MATNDHRQHVGCHSVLEGLKASPMGLYSENTDCNSSRSIQKLNVKPWFDGVRWNFNPTRRIGNLQLTGGSTVECPGKQPS